MIPTSATLLCIILLLSFNNAVLCRREAFKFDFGWKFRTGLKDWALPDDEASKNPDPGLFPPEASTSFNTSSWVDITLPHDGLIANKPSTKACPNGCSGRSFLPRPVLWYKKVFTVPSSWKGSAIWLDFEGSFRNTTVWVNADKVAGHSCGYTPFRLRLDNLTNLLNYGDEKPNDITIYVDPNNGDHGSRDSGSGWWYEGGGLYRHVHLVRTAKLMHIEQDGFFAFSDITFKDEEGKSVSKEAVLNTRLSITNGERLVTKSNKSTGGSKNVCVYFELSDANGNLITATDPTMHTVPTSTRASITITGRMHVSSPQLWSTSKPVLYQVSTTVYEDNNNSCNSGEIIDKVSIMHGFRHLLYDPVKGFFLNKEHFKVRGFCDHDNFAVVGMAVPDRINLFRAQASRAVGGNGRRTSHNPPDPVLLDIYDRLGLVVMDENRLFGNSTPYVINMGALVKRDRNHPSIVIWSFCNEVGCEGDYEKGGPSFQAVTTQLDGSRPTLANMFTFNDLLSNTIDVQGFSHQSREKLEACHAAMPNKPIYSSECCSCNTMRDEDIGTETRRDNPHSSDIQSSFNARCLESNNAVNASDGVDYAVGTMVWTLFDYYGEPPSPPLEISSTYGQFDLCGFPKSAAFWFRTQWLLSIPDDRSDKTFTTNGEYEVHIVESWESPNSWNATKGNTKRTIHAYSNAQYIELLVNGKSQGSKHVVPMAKGPGSYAEWTNVHWESGMLTAVAHDGSNSSKGPLASVSKNTNGKATKLMLSLDAPSKITGTGDALFLDGQDAALVRASIVDERGSVMHFASNNITFSILSGPGIIQGTGNGDPHCYEPNNAVWHSAYHGLVRAVVRVTSVAGLSFHERKMLSLIDHDGPMASSLRTTSTTLNRKEGGEDQEKQSEKIAKNNYLDESDIVIEASSPSFAPAKLTIPTSADQSIVSVLAVAQAEAGKAVDFFAPQQQRDNLIYSTENMQQNSIQKMKD